MITLSPTKGSCRNYVAICTHSVGGCALLLDQLKARSTLEGFSVSVGLSECPQFKVELDLILKTQSTG